MGQSQHYSCFEHIPPYYPDSMLFADQTGPHIVNDSPDQRNKPMMLLHTQLTGHSLVTHWSLTGYMPGAQSRLRCGCLRSLAQESKPLRSTCRLDISLPEIGGGYSLNSVAKNPNKGIPEKRQTHIPLLLAPNASRASRRCNSTKSNPHLK